MQAKDNRTPGKPYRIGEGGVQHAAGRADTTTVGPAASAPLWGLPELWGRQLPAQLRAAGAFAGAWPPAARRIFIAESIVWYLFCSLVGWGADDSTGSPLGYYNRASRCKRGEPLRVYAVAATLCNLVFKL